MSEQRTDEDILDDVFQPFMESGLFRDLNIPKVNALYGEMIDALVSTLRKERAAGVHLAAGIVANVTANVPFSVRPGETSTSNPPMRYVDDVRDHLLDVGNSILAGQKADSA